MFSLNDAQKRDLWCAFAQFSDAGISYIKGALHVKAGGQWRDTSHWSVRDAELAFHIPLESLSVSATALGGVGRCRDWKRANQVLTDLQEKTAFLSPESVSQALTGAGFVLTGTGNFEKLLNTTTFHQTPALILNMLDKPGFFTLIHPEHHPRMRRSLRASERNEKLSIVAGFEVLRDPELYVEAICAYMEQSFKHFEIFRDQVHTLLAYNNLSLQPANALPVPEDADEWLSGVDPILKKSMAAFSADNFDLAAQILQTELQYVYRPIKLASQKGPREPLSALLKNDAGLPAVSGNELRETGRRLAMDVVLAIAPACRLKDVVTTESLFTREEKEFFMERFSQLIKLAEQAPLESIRQANDLLVESIMPWMQDKAAREFERLEQYVHRSFGDKAAPPWYFLQLQSIHPDVNKNRALQADWWSDLRNMARACDPRIRDLLKKAFDADTYQMTVSAVYPQATQAIAWLGQRQFLDCFPDSPKNNVSEGAQARPVRA